MNFVEFPIVLGTAARESQPRRFRCKHGHEVAQDTLLTVSVYGHAGAVMICPVCVVELLGEMCPTEETRPAAPPAIAAPFLVGAVAPSSATTGPPSTVVNPPLPMSEVLRRRREAQGIKAPDAPPAPAPAAAATEAAIPPRAAPYTAAWRCQSHDQPGDAPSEQFCPAERFVSVADGTPFYVPPAATPVANVRAHLERVEDH